MALANQGTLDGDRASEVALGNGEFEITQADRDLCGRLIRLHIL